MKLINTFIALAALMGAAVIIAIIFDLIVASIGKKERIKSLEYVKEFKIVNAVCFICLIITMFNMIF